MALWEFIDDRPLARLLDDAILLYPWLGGTIAFEKSSRVCCKVPIQDAVCTCSDKFTNPVKCCKAIRSAYWNTWCTSSELLFSFFFLYEIHPLEFTDSGVLKSG